MLRLSLDALQILDAIDRRGSFSGAGEELHRVPSTISYTVSKLEQEIGVQLFERQGPRVVFTEAGREMLREGRYLLKAASDLECRVRRVASGWETELTLGIDSLFSPIALQAHITAFFEVADQTRLRLAHETLSGTWEALLDNRVDLLVGAPGEGPAGGGYVAVPIGTIPFVFVVPPDHPLASTPGPISKAELQAHRMIAVADSARRLPPRDVGILFGQDTLAVPDMATKLQFQLAGLGVGFLPEPCARESIRDGRLVVRQVEEPRRDETFYLAWRAGETGAGVAWWVERLKKPGVFDELTRHSFCFQHT